MISEDDLIELQEATRIELAEESSGLDKKVLYWFPFEDVYELHVFNYEGNAFKKITENDLCLAVNEFNNT